MASTHKNFKEKTLNKLPPDGGYGWIIVFSSALSSFLVLSLLQCFGLIFKDTFSNLKLSATEGSFILNLNGSFGKIMGPITGVLLKIYGCRKVGFLAGFLFISGLVVTSFSRSFLVFALSYGLIASLGMQMSESTQRLALNFYFKKKRNVAMGFAVTAAGFGPILVPQLIRFLMKVYPPEQVTLIFAGICTHVFVATSLLQPVHWHMKETEPGKPEEGGLLVNEEKVCNNISKETIGSKILKNIVATFDLDLLKDPIFDNILFGLALATFAELNFTILVPFILHDFGLNTDEIAYFLSTLGIADICFRFVGPYIGNYFTKPSRHMYAYSLTILIVVRFTLLLSKNFYVLLAIAFAWGIAKGVRKVYMLLVIPDHVPLEKLPSSGGMETLANGICILIGGPILGVLRDVTGSYVICIIVMNCVTMITIALWSTEAIIVKYKRKRTLIYATE